MLSKVDIMGKLVDLYDDLNTIEGEVDLLKLEVRSLERQLRRPEVEDNEILC